MIVLYVCVCEVEVFDQPHCDCLCVCFQGGIIAVDKFRTIYLWNTYTSPCSVPWPHKHTYEKVEVLFNYIYVVMFLYECWTNPLPFLFCCCWLFFCICSFKCIFLHESVGYTLDPSTWRLTLPCHKHVPARHSVSFFGMSVVMTAVCLLTLNDNNIILPLLVVVMTAVRSFKCLCCGNKVILSSH